MPAAELTDATRPMAELWPEADALLERAGGARRVDELAPAIGVTRQALARAFAEHVGVSPKVFARVVRMRHALARVEAARRFGWSRVALDLGYHDQAHLTRELRALTGRTPGEWSGGVNPG